MIDVIAVCFGVFITIVFWAGLAWDAINNPISADIPKFPEAPKRGVY